MSVKKLVLILFLFCLAVNSWSEDNHYFFQQISPEYGFTHDAIKTITEDKNGFIWFGSDDGVFYYNTLEIKKIELLRNDSTYISYPRIVKIYKDDKEKLWVCAWSGLFEYNSVLNCFVQKKLYTPELEPIHNNRLDNIIQVESDKYIIIKQGAYFLYNLGDTITKALYKQGVLSGQDITYIAKDKANIIFGTNQGKVYISRNNYTNPELFYDSNKGLISSVCRDGNKYFIGFIEDGIDVINLFGVKINEYNEEQAEQNHQIGNRVRQILKRENGEIWIGAYKGLYILHKDKISHFDFRSNIGLPQSSIYELQKAKNGGIWVGTWGGGIAYFQDFNYHFIYVDPIATDGSKFQNSVTSFAEDNEGDIWIGSERKGMNLYKIKLDEIEKNTTPVHNFNYGISTVRTLLHLNNDKLLIGTFEEGLIYFDPRTEKIESAFKDINNNMTSVCNKSELWIGGFGFRKIDISNGEVQDLRQILLRINKKIKEIRFLYFDSAQNLWICTNAGLYVKFTNTDEFKYCNTTLEGESGYTSIYTCLEDVEGRIWLGTRGKGILIYQPDIDSASKIVINDQISKANIYSLIRDDNDALWFSSNYGIFRFINEYKEVDQFTEYDGLSGRQFNPNAAFLCSNGNLLFGAPNGFSVINPQIIKQNIKRPEVFLAKLLINNEPLSKENVVQCNSCDIAQLNNLTLNPLQTLNIEVISNNFIKSEKNRFRYRLLNYEDNWHEVPQGTEIIYTKIPPGKYILEAYGSNNDKLWSSSPYRLEITVKYLVWMRWYFVLLYIIIFSTIVLIVLKYSRLKNELKTDIEKERFRNQANELIGAERIKFFLNISNEIRTPLSLILSPIQMLLSRFKYDRKTKELLLVIDRNAKRLAKLTNQTLDYRLLEVGKLEPIFEPIEIIELATNTYLYFEQQIAEKQINFSFTSNFKKLEILADTDMVEKIIFNLLSNAVNFTPAKGSISLSIEKNTLNSASYNDIVFVGNKYFSDSIEVKITDTGKGLNPSEINKIFDRFSTGTDKKQSGTGIGLHLCQEYARLNNGNIMVNSKERIGSTFILNLPLKHEKYEKNKKKNRQIIAQRNTKVDEKLNMYFENDSPDLDKRATVLIVENNNEYRQYLKVFLSKYYNAITANKVELAEEIILNLQPDIIITELEFSETDGLEFIQKINNQEISKNIPIIVLTALTESKYHLESISSGANSHFTKPIDSNLLLAKIRSIIRTEQSDKEKKSIPITNRLGSAIEPETFIAIAENIIKENFQNINFSTKELANQLNISESTLFRKIKKQTNLSCTEFMREVKLRDAVNLLNNSSLNIDEIALSAGFNSTSYFVRSFKKKYEKTPRAYRQFRANSRFSS